jgi:predicted PurR-regulated permease PerM
MTLSAYPAARTRARERWHVLSDRLRTIRPEALAKGAIGFILIAVSAQLAVASWPALMPFIVGAVLAYAVLPLATRLDRFMPRVLAALLAELVAVGLLVGVAALVIPPLLSGLGVVVQKLPTPEAIRAAVATLQDQVGTTIPEPMRTIALALMAQTAANLQGALQGLTDQAAGVLTSQILGILGTASNLLGLLVIPAWILTMVSDERAIKQRGARMFPEAVRADVLALFRIADRVASTFLRVRMLLAIVTGVFVYAGVSIANQLGVGDGTYAVAAAVMLGALQLIPELGYILGFVLLLIPLAIGGPVALGVMALVYIASVKGASILLESRLSRGVLDVHPGLLIPAIVVLSQFGMIWLFAAAPLVAIVRDLVRYANARLSEPPGPAGVLPGERATSTRAGRASKPVPSAYKAPVPAATARAASPASPGTDGRAAAPAAVVGATAAAATTVAPARMTLPAVSRTPTPAVYANLQPRTGARQPSATQRSTQP